MKHLKPLTQTPQLANINLDRIFETKVETKENLINAKASQL